MSRIFGLLSSAFLICCGATTNTVSDVKSGNMVGNGGDVLVCSGVMPTNTPSVKVLDVYEAMTMRGLQVKLGGPEVSVQQKVETALATLGSHEPWRVRIYQEKARTFFDDAVFLSGTTLVDIPDSAHIAVPHGCHIEQIAVQRARVLPNDKIYTINQDLWDQLDNDNKAVLILHEIAYGLRVQEGDTNSIRTRVINAHLFSGKFSEMNVTQYWEFWRNVRNFETDTPNVAGLKLEEWPSRYNYHDNGMPMKGKLKCGTPMPQMTLWMERFLVPLYPCIDVEFSNNGTLTGAILFDNTFIRFGSYEFKCKEVSLDNFGNYDCDVPSGNTVVLQGKTFHVRHIYIDKNDNVVGISRTPLSTAVEIQGNLYTVPQFALGDTVYFYQNGVVHKVFGSWIKGFNTAKEFVPGYDFAEFFPTGLLKRTKISQHQIFEKPDGSKQQCKGGSNAEFDQNGFLVECTPL